MSELSDKAKLIEALTDTLEFCVENKGFQCFRDGLWDSALDKLNETIESIDLSGGSDD